MPIEAVSLAHFAAGHWKMNSVKIWLAWSYASLMPGEPMG